MSTDTSLPEDGPHRQSPVTFEGEESAAIPNSASRCEGLWRTASGGPGRTLSEAFADFEEALPSESIERHVARDLISARLSLTPEEGEGYWEFTRIRNDIYVILMNVQYNGRRYERVSGDGRICFSFKLSGDLTLAASSQKQLRVNHPSLLVWAQPPGIEMAGWITSRSQERMISISIRPEFLVEQFLASAEHLPPALQEFVSQPQRNIRYCILPLTAEMYTAAARLINNPLQGKLALIYTEAITLELICAAVGSFCASLGAANKNYTERTLLCLQTARSLITKQVCPPLTVRQISRKIGLSETALRKGFKELYGETILEFSQRCRMQHALVLLRDQHLSVDKVSEMSGYSHPTSFATAFRHHFGVPPRELRHAGFDLDLQHRRRFAKHRGSDAQDVFSRHHGDA